MNNDLFGNLSGKIEIDTRRRKNDQIKTGKIKYRDENSTHDTALHRAEKNLCHDIAKKMRSIMQSDLAGKKVSNVAFLNMIKDRFGIVVSEIQFSKYLSGETDMPLVLVFSFLKVFDISFEFLCKYDDGQLPVDSQQSIADSFFQFFRNEFSTPDHVPSYVFSGNKMDKLFPEEDYKTELEFAFYPLKRSVVKNGKLESLSHQRGTLTFKRKSLERECLCEVEGIFDTDSYGERKIELKGFALLSDPDQPHEVCWCLLKRKLGGKNIIWAICFRTKDIFTISKEQENDDLFWRSPRVGNLLTLRAYDHLPVTYKILLWKKTKSDMVHANLSRYIGFTKLNTKLIHIKDHEWDLTTAYLMKKGEGEDVSGICEILINKIREEEGEKDEVRAKFKIAEIEKRFADIENHFKDVPIGEIKEMLGFMNDLKSYNMPIRVIDYTRKFKKDKDSKYEISNAQVLNSSMLLTSWLRYLDYQLHYSKTRDDVNADLLELYKELRKHEEKSLSADISSDRTSSDNFI